MGFNCGIVGLPNVGKSTLFNALTQTIAAQAANFPFCTIEPNTGRVAVPDERLEKLRQIVNPKTVTPTQLEFVDIAGLVKGASKGEVVASITKDQLKEIAEIKLPDLNAYDVEAAMKIVAGTARNMGIEIKD